jgi:hypothetical protein
MFTRIAGIAAARSGKLKALDDERIYTYNLAQEMRILQKHADFFTFQTWPIALWLPGAIIFAIASVLCYLELFKVLQVER